MQDGLKIVFVTFKRIFLIWAYFTEKLIHYQFIDESLIKIENIQKKTKYLQILTTL